MRNKIAYQGEPGANSHIACNLYDDEVEAVALKTFDHVFSSLKNGDVNLAMIPIENSIAGRVSDIHRLMPTSDVHIIGESFLKIQHCLMSLKDSSIGDIKYVRSHEMALSQCRESIAKLNIEPVVSADTAGSAREVSELGDKSTAAIASPLASEIYNLKILKEEMEDAGHNTTRFLILSKDQVIPNNNEGNYITTLVFKIKNVPSALYKALGGFATNGVNMLKLESYQLDGNFQSTQFYTDLEGHSESEHIKNAINELQYYSEEIKILGVYPSSRK
ncbi:MAG: prephenate dehydratase [Alphaproteobacteria bacterium]